MDPEQKLVEVLPVSGAFDHAAPLRLDLRASDRPGAGSPPAAAARPSWAGAAAADIDGSHDWNVRLGPVDAHWRLQGRLPKDQLATNLRPRLQAQ